MKCDKQMWDSNPAYYEKSWARSGDHYGPPQAFKDNLGDRNPKKGSTGQASQKLYSVPSSTC
jgi:hypothetical protein